MTIVVSPWRVFVNTSAFAASIALWFAPACATSPSLAAPAMPAQIIRVGPHERYQHIQQALDSLDALPSLGNTATPAVNAVAQQRPTPITATTSAPINDWVLIKVQPGVYREKLYLTRDRVVIAGSGMGTTIVQYPELRQHFLAPSAAPTLPRGAALARDWGAAVVNINATDIALLDVTVHNSYALEHPSDPARFGHQFAVRGFAPATRFITDHAEFLTFGADTMAMWNKPHGQYYHSHSRFVGRVDLFCPRGSAVVEHSEFVNHSATATLWHDGEGDPHQVLLVRHSKFIGVSGFELGRRHYDGQFVLIGNQFSNAMASRAIYRRTYPTEPWRDQANRYGDRNYFWHNEQLATTPASGASATSPTVWRDNLTEAQAAQYDADVLFPQWKPTQQLALFRQWLRHDAADHSRR